MAVPRLTDEEVDAALAGSAWERTASGIRRTFTFSDFRAAVSFVNEIAEKAERANHHPDIAISWNKVTLTLTTHDAGGVSQRDIDMRTDIDSMVGKHRG